MKSLREDVHRCGGADTAAPLVYSSAALTNPLVARMNQTASTALTARPYHGDGERSRRRARIRRMRAAANWRSASARHVSRQ